MTFHKNIFFKLFGYLGIGFAVAIIAVAMYITRPSVLVWVDNKVYDTFLKLVPKSPPSDVPVIIDIDERSLETYGQWPWSRYILAALIEAVASNNPASIALDILLAEPDRTSPELIQGNLRRDFGLEVKFEGLPDYLNDNDKLFADYISRMPVIVGMYVSFGQNGDNSTILPAPLNVSILSSKDSAPLDKNIIRGTGASLPLKIFSDVASVGVINAITDIDGVIRRAPAIIGIKDKDGETVLYPNLALMSIIKAYGANSVILKTGPDGIESIRVKNLTIPLEGDGSFPILYKGKNKTYKYISAVDILSGSYAPEDLAGKIVFIGSSAPGLLDIRSTPMDEYYSGVEIHAAAVDSMISGDIISIPVWIPGLQFILIVLISVAGALAAGKLSPYFSLPAAFIMLSAIWYGGYLSFSKGLFISPFFISIGLLLSVFTVIAARFLYEAHDKKILRNTFSRYVSPEVVAQIADKGFDLFAGEEKVVTAIFTDIRGFTSISEKLSPQNMVRLLNSYFAPMTDLIRGSQGTLDKFIGDAIMAFWNAPLEVKGHEALAVGTAIDMQKRLKEINVKLKEEFDVELRIGAGINTGSVYVGNMGSQELINYTIIGDNVNLASRLEGLCSKFGVTIVCSGATAEKCEGKFVFQQIDNLRVKGKSQAVDVYFAMTIEEGLARKIELDIYAAALGLYMKGDFEEAKKNFDELIENYPNSVTLKLYEIYSTRCADLMEHQPTSWDGVWALDSK